MNRLPALSPLLLLLLLAGCAAERPTEAEYLGVAAQAIRVAAEDARANAPQGSGTGPLLLDVKSFAGGGFRATGEVVPTERVQAALERILDEPFRPTPPDSSFDCIELELGNTCWVPRNGVFVRLNVASRGRERLVLYVTSTVTATHFIPPVLCDRVLKLVYVRRGEEWALQEKTPTRTC